MGLTKANQTSFKKGEHHSPNTEFKKGMKVPKEILEKRIKSQTGLKHTEEQKLKISGEKSFNWKGGKPKCIDCGKQLASIYAKRCQNCAKKREKNVNWKGGIAGKYLLEEREKIANRKRPEQCEICGAFGSDSKKGICFDHDHNTGKFRGWICHRCNVVLGFVKDNKELLLAMIEYLKNNE